MPDHSPTGRTIEVPLARLERWLGGVADRHGQWQAVVADGTEDGATGTTTEGTPADATPADAIPADAIPAEGTPAIAAPADAIPADAIPADATPAMGAGSDRSAWLITTEDGFRAVVHEPVWRPMVYPQPLGSLTDLSALAPSFGAILIRRAGYAVGLFVGSQLVERKVGSRHIHGRTAAGGWSQQRYARRRANQADEIVDAAARAAAQILGAAGGAGRVAAPGGPRSADRSPGPPPPAPPTFLVTGGDRPLLAAVVDQLSPPLADLPVAQHLGIGTPDADVLAGIPARVLAVRIDLDEP